MKVKKIKEYSKTPKESISNQYTTKKHSFKEPGIKLVVGTRGTGKSFTTAKIMLEAQREKLFDVTYFITLHLIVIKPIGHSLIYQRRMSFILVEMRLVLFLRE